MKSALAVFQGHGFMPVYNGPLLSHRIPNLRRNKEYKFRVSKKFFFFYKFELGHKMVLNAYVNNKSSDQPEYKGRLIRAFAVALIKFGH